MLTFENDYSEGAHEKVLQHLFETNMEQLSGYGTDIYCQQATEKIKQACQCPEADVRYLVGGTQANQVVIHSLLQDYEGVIAASTGHISTHEAGAIEFTGHKVLTLEPVDGKITAAALTEYLETFYGDENHEHMVFPGMVYITYPTEFGTLYSREEMASISEICRQYHLPLYLDGARLGYGLMSDDADMTLADIAALCDVFYIGGTKVGALCGEAVVFTHKNAPQHFLTTIKQNGALMAKGRVLGVQFDALFTDDLYFNIARHAIEMANILKAGLKEKGYKFFIDSPTNQQFVIVENEQMQELKKKVRFSFWDKWDDAHTVIRFATSWATKVEDVYRLLELL